MFIKEKTTQGNTPESLRIETLPPFFKAQQIIILIHRQSWKKTGLIPQSMPVEYLVTAMEFL